MEFGGGEAEVEVEFGSREAKVAAEHHVREAEVVLELGGREAEVATSSRSRLRWRWIELAARCSGRRCRQWRTRSGGR